MIDTPRERPRPWTIKSGYTLPLQRCAGCGSFQHPPREICGRCLGDSLEWGVDGGCGALLGISTVHSTFDARLQKFLPLVIGSVRLDCGPVLIAYLDDDASEIGQRVRVMPAEDELKQHIFVAVPESAAIDDRPESAIGGSESGVLR